MNVGAAQRISQSLYTERHPKTISQFLKGTADVDTVVYLHLSQEKQFHNRSDHKEVRLKRSLSLSKEQELKDVR